MTQGMVNFITSLLEVADESAALSQGLKGKPYRYYGDVIKYGYSLKKKEKKQFEQIYNAMAGDKPGSEHYKTFNLILANYRYLNDITNES